MERCTFGQFWLLVVPVFTLFLFLHLSLLFSHWTQSAFPVQSLRLVQYHSSEPEWEPTVVLLYLPLKELPNLTRDPLSQEPPSSIILPLPVVSLTDHCLHSTTFWCYSETYESSCLEMRLVISSSHVFALSIVITVVLNCSLIETTCWSSSRLPTVHLSPKNIPKTFYLVCKWI